MPTRADELAQDAADHAELLRLREENALLVDRVNEVEHCLSSSNAWILKKENEIRELKARIIELGAQIEREEVDGK